MGRNIREYAAYTSLSWYKWSQRYLKQNKNNYFRKHKENLNWLIFFNGYIVEYLNDIGPVCIHA